MAAYNLCLFFILRDRSYLYYVLFVTSLGLYHASLDGYAGQLLWPNLVYWGNVAVLVFIGLSLLTSVRFTAHFLNVKAYRPGLAKFLRGLQLATAVLIGFSVLPGTYRVAAPLISILTLISVGSALTTGVIAWRQNFQPARYYLLAWAGVIIGATLVVLQMFGLLPISFWTQYSLRLGVLWLVLLLSVALADRITLAEREKAEALRRLKQANDELENRVETRTAELAAANQQLRDDINLQQIADRLIHQQNEFLQTIIEALSNPFYVINVDDYSIQVANAAAGELCQARLSHCYVLNQSLSPCDEVDHPCPLKILRNTKAPVVMEHRHYNQAGELRYVEVHAYPILDESGQLRQMVEYSIDITERKQAEEELRKLSRAVEQSGSAVVITDLTGRIQFVNPAFGRITGYSFTEAIGQSTNILKSGQQSAELYRHLWDTIHRGEVWQGELINKKKNGELYWEYSTISPVKDAQGVTTHYLAVKEDITQRKAAEAALQAANEALTARVDELSTLNLIMETVSTVTDLDTTLEIIGGTLTRLLNAAHCTIALLSPSETNWWSR